VFFKVAEGYGGHTQNLALFEASNTIHEFRVEGGCDRTRVVAYSLALLPRPRAVS
jgi:hypothetical protein